ncbi:MAG: S9 family peptidase [Gallionella sp.]|nr:S9 family peptidase [Gallionella sp.]MDD4959268.1 S9 family peptidase [Gallionella sp.]
MKDLIPFALYMKIPSLLILIATLTGCATSAVHPSLKTATGLPELIPVHDFVANRGSNFNYQISPDGKKLAWIAVKGVSLHIYIKNLENNTLRTIPAGMFHGVPDFVWAQDNRHLICNTLNESGTENTLVVTIDTEQADENKIYTIISPFGGVKSLLVHQIPNDAVHLLISNNQRDKTVFDLYRVNIDNKEQTLIAQNPGNVTQWLTSPQGELTGRIVKQANNYSLEIIQQGGKGYKSVYQWTSDDNVSVVGTLDKGSRVYLLSNKGRDRKALIELAADSGMEKLIYADPTVDISRVYTHPVTGEPLIAFLDPDYPKAVVLDHTLDAAFGFMKNQAHANFDIVSSDNPFHHLTINMNSDKGYEYYLYDLEHNHLELLGSSPSLVYKDSLTDTKPIEIMSRDHIPLHGYLTLPKDVPAHRLPMVLWVHGGPWGRVLWHYDSEIQFLANRGYAVMQINFRGSTGYGRHFEELAVGEFAGKMQDDLLDGVDWAIAQGIADPAKIAIVGGSYGGYAALVGLSFTPDTFACGIDMFGPTELVKLVEDFPPYWKLEMDLWYRYAGDPAKEADRKIMQAKSPLYKAADITKPLMVIQGEDDVRVRKEQSIEMVDKLKQYNKNVDFWLVPGAGHGLSDWPLKLTQFRKTEDFLAGCLGGRSSGFDYYQLGSWLF